jgi:hypothetical protein
MILLRELPHVDVAAAKPQRRLNRLTLVLEGGTGQVEVQAVRSRLLGGSRDEPEPTCVSSPGNRTPLASPTISRPSTPAQNAAKPAGS